MPTSISIGVADFNPSAATSLPQEGNAAARIDEIAALMSSPDANPEIQSEIQSEDKGEGVDSADM